MICTSLLLKCLYFCQDGYLQVEHAIAISLSWMNSGHLLATKLISNGSGYLYVGRPVRWLAYYVGDRSETSALHLVATPAA